jgi:hypothetical protein
MDPKKELIYYEKNEYFYRFKAEPLLVLNLRDAPLFTEYGPNVGEIQIFEYCIYVNRKL